MSARIQQEVPSGRVHCAPHGIPLARALEGIHAEFYIERETPRKSFQQVSVVVNALLRGENCPFRASSAGLKKLAYYCGVAALMYARMPRVLAKMQEIYRHCYARSRVGTAFISPPPLLDSKEVVARLNDATYTLTQVIGQSCKAQDLPCTPLENTLLTLATSFHAGGSVVGMAPFDSLEAALSAAADRYAKLWIVTRCRSLELMDRSSLPDPRHVAIVRDTSSFLAGCHFEVDSVFRELLVEEVNNISFKLDQRPLLKMGTTFSGPRLVVTEEGMSLLRRQLRRNANQVPLSPRIGCPLRYSGTTINSSLVALYDVFDSILRAEGAI